MRLFKLYALVAGVMLAVPGAGLAVTPVNGTLPAVTHVTINNGPGDQTDPHVSGDLVSYTSQINVGSEIRYFDFASLADNAIPNALPGGGSGFDFLSDVSGSTIGFVRVVSGRGAIYAFDVASGSAVEVDPQAGSNRRATGIGDGTVAWIDASFAGGELFAHDRVSGTTQRLTTDAAFDRRPQVSPDGNVIVWESCTSFGSGCDVLKAVRSAGTWSVDHVAISADEETNPDTNGSIVVYGASRGSSQAGADIYWTPVAGGTETQLGLDGAQNNPAVSGNLIVFESQVLASSTTDVFAHDLSTNALYQLTNTPGLSETLSDVSVSASGQVRVVWSVFEQDENVYGLSFQLASASVLAARVQPPVNADGSSTFNAKRGVVPLKFTLTENGSPTCDLPPATLRLTRTGAASPGPIDESVYSGRSDSGSEFRIADCQYQYNVNASALGTGSYLAEILSDGAVVGDARFALK